ncbi:hypothetical protein E3Q22_02783 [Wallemia mellicola]|uniref:Uncharacterized protein n=1 Tax=Wallemia mellicola TaxID=1708541 RepID=A0A4T0RWZ1_9BASI|nr:hypothetical protein E3Q22_02783 [Wallemia mellicola]TIC01612.1 hypothetical protein E3Q17_01783 [Wallemia mellicola]TIC05343.1 hypothetical protein E3Q16_02256 [Wallemia mellicola]TIC42491.1 hypothetical protein E3Q08_02811 [Wallemia mellicola]
MRFDDLRLALAILLSTSIPRNISTKGEIINYVELFTLTIESLSKRKYPSQLASELDDEIARLELLRFMTGDSTDRVEISAPIPTESARNLMQYLQLLNSKPCNLESQIHITTNVYKALADVLVSYTTNGFQLRIISMLINMIKGVYQETITQLKKVTDDNTLMSLPFGSTFSSTVIHSLIKLLTSSNSIRQLQLEIIDAILDLINNHNEQFAMDISLELINQLHDQIQDRKVTPGCLISLIALLSVSISKTNPTHNNLSAILMHLAPLSGSKSQNLSDIPAKHSIDGTFERVWGRLNNL